MKVAILGYGNVGMATFHTFMNMPEIHELVLCGRNKDKIEGELADFKDSLALNYDIKTRIKGGGYEMTAGADIIVYTIGPSIKNHTTDRMSLSKVNIDIAREVSEELNKYNRDAIIHDTHQILIVSVTLNGEYGIDGVSLSVPCSVSSCGASAITSTTMTKEELDALTASAEVIRSNS